jgi:hypothetical protein
MANQQPNRVAPVIQAMNPDEKVEDRMKRLEALQDNLDVLLVDIPEETGKLVLTKESWAKHNAFEKKFETFKPKLDKAGQELTAATSQLGTLALDQVETGADDFQRIQKILAKGRKASDRMRDECFAVLLHSLGDLDALRDMDPRVSRLLFNYELEPLRKECERLNEKIIELQTSSYGGHEVQVPGAADDRYGELRKRLENAQLLNVVLSKRLGEPAVVAATQIVARPQELQQPTPADVEVSRLIALNVSQEALLRDKDAEIQRQKERIDALGQEARDASSRIEALELKLPKHDNTVRGLRDRVRTLEGERNDWKNKFKASDREKTRLDQELANCNQRLEEESRTHGSLQDELAILDINCMKAVRDAKDRQRTIDDLTDMIGAKDSELFDAEQKNEAFDKEVAELQHLNDRKQHAIQKVVQGKKSAQAASKKLLVRISELEQSIVSKQNTIDEVVKEKVALQRKSDDESKEMRKKVNFLRSIVGSFSSELHTDESNDETWLEFFTLLGKMPVHVLQVEEVEHPGWLIAPPTSAGTICAGTRDLFLLRLVFRLFVCIHNGDCEESTALDIIYSIQELLPESEDPFAARALVEVSLKACARVQVTSPESAMFTLAILQLYMTVSARYPGISKLDDSGVDQVIPQLLEFCKASDSLIGEICDVIYHAQIGHTHEIESLNSFFRERMIVYPDDGPSLISDFEFDWVVMFWEDEGIIALTSKALFYVHEETTLDIWKFGVKKPSKYFEATFEHSHDDDEYQWWENYILSSLSITDEVKQITRDFEKGLAINV